VVTELAKEVPYYAGALGTAVLSDSVSSNDALVFLGGANLGAAAYELGLARMTWAVVARRQGRATLHHVFLAAGKASELHAQGYSGIVLGWARRRVPTRRLS
jgi:hypothetical protein